ncbi:hypothetical protein [Granulicella sibirica]|uniref:Uncharacterized protein n=1 Tax=Granulicella sibirica TaxID=2479048 RepID=A0A4Q0T224_9BACT|nr:hypothetical protein [Granulicella sibirica]RXH57643.1 hypothetical protein GRAN_0953 [Granulicella sibirica]
MKIETAKTPNLTKVIAAGVLAGAVLMAAPQKAEAQQFGVSVGVGRPYGGPVYERGFRDDRFRDDRGFYAERRRDEFRRQEAFARQERWDREHRFYRAPAYGFGYGR